MSTRHKNYYTLLVILIGFLSTNIQAGGDRKEFIPIQTSEISAESLFIDSKIVKVPAVRKSLNLGDNYSYKKNLNSNTHDLFRIRIAGLFHQYQERVSDLGFAPGRRLEFNKEDNINLGIDIDFEVGKVLSSDTFITDIIQYYDSNVVDGKVIENYEYIDKYRIVYKLKSSGREYKLNTGHTLSGNFDTEKYYVNFHSGMNEKLNNLTIMVTEKSTIKSRKGKRPNDTVLPKGHKQLNKEQLEAFFKQRELEEALKKKITK